MPARRILPPFPPPSVPMCGRGKGRARRFLVTGVGGVTHFNWARRFGRRMVGCDPQRHQSSCRSFAGDPLPHHCVAAGQRAR
uniref:Predicted protein n=1 Tax=Hordeum vulgare subsp. vulgare TaxID=112509 RepID=F2E4F6_HORVV|nr:predicted protein [Hordeum vulgare subsp. vulgare]